MKAFVEVLYTIPEDGGGTVLKLYVYNFFFFFELILNDMYIFNLFLSEQ